MEINRIYNENCLDTLRRMPDEFVDCVVTSPPYYGLRAYSAPDSIWGGDKKCAHEWQTEITKRPNANGGKNGTLNPDRTQSAFVDYSKRETSSDFCACGAWKGQLGLEPTFQMYIDHLIEIFREIKRVLKKDGSVWVNLGDSYSTTPSGKCENPFKASGITKSQNQIVARQTKESRRLDKSVKNKSLLNIPNRFAIRMTDELGFILRNELIWHKPACMPSSATDRFTVDFEKIFFFTKSQKYYFEQQKEPIAKSTIGRGLVDFGGAKGRAYTPDKSDPNFRNGNEQWGRTFDYTKSCADGRNMRTVWSIPFEPQSESHYASYPTRLIETPIKAGCRENGIVYEPFTGTGTTLVVAHRLGRNWIGSEISKEYCDIAEKRLEPYLAQAQLF